MGAQEHGYYWMGAQEHGYYSILERKCTHHTASNRQPAEGLGTSELQEPLTYYKQLKLDGSTGTRLL